MFYLVILHASDAGAFWRKAFQSVEQAREYAARAIDGHQAAWAEIRRVRPADARRALAGRF